MTIAQPVLPENPDELRTFTLALQANFAAIQTRNQVLEDELYAKTLHIEKLKMQLAALRRARFGRSSEKLDREIEQLEMAVGEPDRTHHHGGQPRPALVAVAGAVG